jgi:hypothetical protein
MSLQSEYNFNLSNKDFDSQCVYKGFKSQIFVELENSTNFY